MKYVRFKHLGIVMFNETQDHKQMAERLGSAHDPVISAGFVKADDYCDDGKVCVQGRSFSLDIGPLEEDETMLRIMLKR